MSKLSAQNMLLNEGCSSSEVALSNFKMLVLSMSDNIDIETESMIVDSLIDKSKTLEELLVATELPQFHLEPSLISLVNRRVVVFDDSKPAKFRVKL